MENKVFTIEDLNKNGINLFDTRATFLSKLNIQNTSQAIIVNTGRFLTIITIDGQKIIYDTNNLTNFNTELISEIIISGDSPERIDEIVDNYNGKDTFGIVIDENGKPWHPERYLHTIIDDPENIEKFLKQYKNHVNKSLKSTRHECR